MTGTHATHIGSLACKLALAGLEPAIFGSEGQRLTHSATGPYGGRLRPQHACKCNCAIYYDSLWQLAPALALTLATRPPPGLRSTRGLAAVTSTSHAEGRQFDHG